MRSPLLPRAHLWNAQALSAADARSCPEPTGLVLPAAFVPPARGDQNEKRGSPAGYAPARTAANGHPAAKPDPQTTLGLQKKEPSYAPFRAPTGSCPILRDR